MDNDGTGHEYDYQPYNKHIIGKETQYMERHIGRFTYSDTTITEQKYCIDQPQHSPVFQANPEIERKTDQTKPFLIGTTKPLHRRKHWEPGQDFITWQNDHQNS